MTTSPTPRPILARLWPSTLASQLIILLLAAIVAAQAFSIWIFQDERRIALVAAARDNLLSRAVSLAELMEDTPANLQDRILVASSSRFAVFWLGDTPLAPAPGKSRFERRLQGYMADRLEHGQTVHLNILADERRGPRGREADDDDDPPRWRDVPRHERPSNLRKIMNKPEDLSLSIRMSDGRWLNVATSYRPPAGDFLPLLVQLSITVLLMVLIIGFAVRRVTRPLKELSVAAEKFGRGEQQQPLTPSGPSEVRSLTSAFNDMQDRLTRFVRDRTRMLAAISHDLRTPITSLRLRAEFIEDEENRDKMIETLEEMAAMTEAALRFTRDDAQTENAENADLGAILEALAGDQQDLGHQCSVETEGRIVLPCRPMALKRALRNLIENGIRYGDRVSVHAARSAGEALIRITDEGPGIPEERLKDVFEPFVRLEESRNDETGGIGLGLAITRSIIHAHGGRIDLKNRPEGGLEADIRLPLGAGK
ncbi:sensor histidine kinase [Stappia aggregata IAM 12614]|uniref:histidine kinase n=1 Tax=Roseibium aggregatum (strain ATCC 25650 / DSM 13394 / JCM 20685 / NBRC 16684 / NCIMB 2208 / IAM 12614 / B1) TaxID=384765 RepID=A0P2F5_ROSAI|nr:ATP-binding protein [Roseibium aggregatum]EAV40819.1 sensor histidine kinase [Stappia aggregata IAM 12614] [Roseibium aggregatum IAM 12614]